MQLIQQQIIKYFNNCHALTSQLLAQISYHLLQYQQDFFWNFIVATFKNIKLKPEVFFRFIVKLMDEETIRKISQNDKYMFLLFKHRLGDAKRLALIANESSQSLSLQAQSSRFQFITLLQLWTINQSLPQYLIYRSMFLQKPNLTLNTLLQSVQDEKIKIKINNAIKKQPNNTLTQVDLHNLIKVILPINMLQIELLKDKLWSKDLLENNFSESEQIIPLIGGTGLGKSTLILWLLGYQIDRTKDQKGFFQLSPVGPIKEEHKSIVGKSDLNSVTNKIHFAQLLTKINQSIIFADTPGFQDTRGLTRSLFNHYTLQTFLFKKYKKLKLVVVVDSEKILLQRVQKVKQFAQFISNNFKYTDSNQLNQHLTVILNKCRSDFQDLQTLKQILQESEKIEMSPRQRQVVKFMKKVFCKGNNHSEVPNAVPKNFYKLPNRKEELLRYLRSKQGKDPEETLKRYIHPALDQAIKTNLEYYSSCISQWLSSHRFDIALYYFSMLEQLAGSVQRTEFINAVAKRIMAVFESLREDFSRVIQQKSDRVYEKEDFQSLRIYRNHLKMGQIFQPYFGDHIKTHKSLNILKQQIFQGYKQNMFSGKCSEQQINNYRQFLQLFQEDEDQCLVFIEKKQRIWRNLQNLMRTQSYQLIDKQGELLKQTSNLIRNLSPQSNSISDQDVLRQKMNDFVSQKFKTLKQRVQEQIDKLKLYNSLIVQLQDSPHLLQQSTKNAIKDYQKLNQSTILTQIKEGFDEKVMLKQLSQEIIKIIQQFKLGLNKNVLVKANVIKNFKSLTNSYLQLNAINQLVSPYLDELVLSFKATKDNAIKSIEQYSNNFRHMLESNEEWPQVLFKTEKIRKQIKDIGFICEYLDQPYSTVPFIDGLKTMLDTCQGYSKKIDLSNSKFDKSLFVFAANKYQKLRKLKEIEFLEIKQSVEQTFTLNQTEYFGLIDGVRGKLRQNFRLSVFITKIDLDNFFNLLQFTSQICERIQKFQQFQVNLKDEQDEIYGKILTVIDMPINYQIQPKIQDHLNNNQIFIVNLFKILQFCLQITTIPYFLSKFKEKDVCMEILEKLQDELNSLYSQIGSIADEVESAKRKLYRIQIEKVNLSDFNFSLHSTKIDELKFLKGQIWQKINAVDSSFQYKQLIFRDNQDQFEAFTRFRQLYEKNLQRNIKDEKNFHLFRDFMRKVITREQQDISEKIQNYVKSSSSYKNLKKIREELARMELKIQQLNTFMTQLQEQIFEIIEEYCSKIQKMIGINQIDWAGKQMQKFNKLINSAGLQINVDLAERIKNNKNIIQGKQQEIKQIKQKFKYNRNINLFDSFQEIILYAKNGILSQFKSGITILLKKQINAISDRNVDFIGFKEKYDILKIIADNLFDQKEKIKNHMLEKLRLAQENMKTQLSNIIKESFTNNSIKNHLTLLDLICKCKQFQLYHEMRQLQFLREQKMSSLDQIIHKDSLDLKSIFNQLQTNFWIADIPEYIKRHFNTINTEQQLYFIRKIIAIKIQPQIKKINQQLQKNTQFDVQINESVFYQCMNLLRSHKALLFNQMLYEKMQEQIMGKLDTLRLKYLPKYTQVLNIECYKNFSVINYEVVFAKYYELLTKIMKQICPSSTFSKEDKLQQFQNQIQNNYQMLLQFKFSERELQQNGIYTSLDMEIFLQKLSFLIRLIMKYNSPIQQYNPQFKSKLSLHYSKRQIQCKQMLRKVFISAQTPTDIHLKEIIRNIEFERISAKIKNMSISKLLTINSGQSFFKELSHFICESKTLVEQNEIAANIIQNAFLLKKISLFFTQFSEQCEQIIRDTLSLVYNSQSQIQAGKLRQKISRFKDQSPFHCFVASYLQDKKQCQLMMNPIQSLWRSYNRYKDIEHIYKSVYQSQTIQRKFTILLGLLGSTCPQIKVQSIEIFKIAAFLQRYSKIQPFVFGKMFQISWRQKNIVATVLTAMLRIQGYQTYLVYSSHEKKQQQKKKYKQFFKVIQKQANVVKDNFVTYTTFADLFKDYTNNIKLDDEVLDQLHKTAYQRRKENNKKVFIIQDHHQIYQKDVLKKKCELFIQIKQWQLVKYICQVLFKNEGKGHDDILRDVKASKYYKETVQKYTSLQLLIERQVSSIIKYYCKMGMDYDKQKYAACNQSLYARTQIKWEDALTVVEDGYETLFASFIYAKRQKISKLNFQKFLKLRLKIYQTSFHKFVLGLKSKYNFVAFSLKSNSGLQQLSRKMMGLEKMVMEDVIQQIRPSKPLLTLQNAQTQLSFTESCVILFNKCTDIDSFVSSNHNINSYIYQTRLDRIDQTLDSSKIQLKLKAFPFFSRTLLVSFQAIKSISSVQLFYPQHRNRISVLLTYLPKDSYQLQQIRSTLNLLNANIELILIYETDIQRDYYYNKLNGFFNNFERLKIIDQLSKEQKIEDFQRFSCKSISDITADILCNDAK